MYQYYLFIVVSPTETRFSNSIFQPRSFTMFLVVLNFLGRNSRNACRVNSTVFPQNPSSYLLASANFLTRISQWNLTLSTLRRLPENLSCEYSHLPPFLSGPELSHWSQVVRMSSMILYIVYVIRASNPRILLISRVTDFSTATFEN